jgi:D-glycero-D-manno-heptose 1,7-bisphosphate phosphatase
MVLLDRDGTLNASPATTRYVVLPEDAQLLPDAGEAVRLLNDADVPVVVVTNQRGLATGRLTSEQLSAVHAVLVAQLASCGAHVESWYVCPHDIGQCGCRKPLPGLLLQALAERPGSAPEQCRIIGDAESDMLAGAALRMPGILLAKDPTVDTVAEAVCPSLLDAVGSLLQAAQDTEAALAAKPAPDAPRAANLRQLIIAPAPRAEAEEDPR